MTPAAADFGVIVPTLRPKAWARRSCVALRAQTVAFKRLLVVDSGSAADELDAYREIGAEVVVIEPSAFDHGGTRDMGLRRLAEREFVVFLTQDAILASAVSIERLLAAFADPDVSVVCGRQLPRPEAGAIERFSRLSGYPETPSCRSIDDITHLGIKAAFVSNSFSAYRVSHLIEAGGFSPAIFGEDMLAAARLLLAGRKVRYVPEATVIHSHDFSMGQVFGRYFDIGVSHALEREILERFGRPDGEGLRYVLAETRYLLRQAPYLIPYAWLTSAIKFLAYRLGKVGPALPVAVSRALSANPGYWQRGAPTSRRRA